jgi:hypothetical protein
MLERQIAGGHQPLAYSSLWRERERVDRKNARGGEERD